MKSLRAAARAFASHRHEGQFWLPTAPSERVRGRLKLGRHGRIKLTQLEGDDDSYLFSRAAHAHGEIGATAVTLWADADTNFVFGAKPPFFTRWGTALLGGHLPSEDEALFARSSVTFEGIDMWTRTEPIPDGAPRPEYAPAEIEDAYGEGIDVVIRIENVAAPEARPGEPAAFRRFLGENGRITFVTSPATPLSFHRRLWFDLRDLITFATQQAAYLFDHIATTPRGEEVTVTEYRPGSPPKMRTHASKMLLSPAQVDPSVMFPNWWGAIEALYPVPQVLAARYYSSRAYVEGHAISALGAAERLHELLGLEVDRFPRTFFREQVKALRAHAKTLNLGDESEEFHRYLREVLQNRRPLRARFRELGEVAGVRQLAAAGIDLDLWLDAVAKARDTLTHTGSHVTGRTDADADVLFQVDHATRVVLSLALRSRLAPEPLSPLQAQSALLHHRWKLEHGSDGNGTDRPES